MNIAEILLQLYQTGILALAIVMLAIAIITYPTIQKRSHKRNRNSR